MTTRRTPVRPKRATKRRRDAPEWTPEEWDHADQLLRIRSEGRCEHCGDYPGPLDRMARHHRQRRRDGGDRLSNLLFVLERCHRSIHDHPESARANGWIVSAFESDPAAVPVRYRGDKLWTLDDFGARRFIP